MAWNGKPHFAVAHDDMSALPDNPESQLSKNANSLVLADAGNFGHGQMLNSDFRSFHALYSALLGFRFEPELDRFPDIFQRFIACVALGMASLQIGT
jgi:hypothetical protein